MKRKDINVYIRDKKGYYYAVIVYKNAQGKRKEKWFPTKLPIRGNKKKAEAIADQILEEFEIPAEDLCLKEKSTKLGKNCIANATLDDLTQSQVANLLFSDYIIKYLPLTRKRRRKIEDTTYSGYEANVKSVVAPYFAKKKIKLKDLTAKDIQDFYDKQLERVKPNSVIRYHAIIRLSLCHARKMRYIKENPIEEVEKPEKNQFIGKFYTAEELSRLIELAKGTKLEIPVIMGGFYGLRRSEVLGLRWSAIDFENNIFYINHTVTTPKIDGVTKIVAKDRAKTKSSLRALPLGKDVKEILISKKQQQEEYRKKFKSSYNKKWLDYVMVDELGDLITPDYITGAFKSFLAKHELREIRFHDLRHTCASLLLNKGKHEGITLKDIQVWLGHSDFSTTANTYSHLDATSKSFSLTALEKAITF